MTKDDALKLALEALELIGMKNWSLREDKAITAIKEALANEALEKMAENARELGLDYEPAQKPVAWAKFSAKGNIIDLLNEPDDGYTPLYATSLQRTWVNATTWRGLTDEEYAKLAEEFGPFPINQIEAALKAKNT